MATSGVNSSPRCLILGGGGHAKIVVDVLALTGMAGDVAVLDRDLPPDATVLGAPVIGDDGFLDEARRRGYSHFIVGLGGDPRRRRRLYEAALAVGLEPLSAIHPTAVVANSARIGSGTLLAAGAVINPDARVLTMTLHPTQAVVEHDSLVADHVHLAPASCVLGGCRVEEEAMVGAGAVIRQGVRVGAFSLVAAGAVVTAEVAAGARVMGIPARPIAGSPPTPAGAPGSLK